MTVVSYVAFHDFADDLVEKTADTGKFYGDAARSGIGAENRGIADHFAVSQFFAGLDDVSQRFDAFAPFPDACD